MNNYCPECKAGDYDACTGRTDDPCPYCGKVNRHACPIWDGGLHDYCFGCAGYPFCDCRTKHAGDCTEATRKR